MFVKLKPVVLFVSLVGLSCFVLNFAAIDNSLSAQETQPSIKEESTVQKSENPVCNVHPACDIHSHTCHCHHQKHCSHIPGCYTPCKKRSECYESGRVDNLLDIAKCAKKQLLKEKIKAKLETRIGVKLDKVADLLVDTMLEECEIDRESKELRSALKEKLSEIFSEKAGK